MHFNLGLFYLRRYKNWFLTVLIFTISFFTSELICYEWTMRIIQKDIPFFTLVYETIDHALFLYASIIILSVLLICLFKILGFFRKKEVEKLLEDTTRELRLDNRGLLKKLDSYYSIMNQAPIGICLTHNDKIQLCNSAMAPFWLIKPEKAVRKNMASLFTVPKEIKKIMDRCTTQLTKKEYCSLQSQITCPGGERILYQVSAFHADKYNSRQGIIWLFQDFSFEARNIELEKYYQTVFRALRLLHDFNDNDNEYDLLRQILNEIIGIYGLKTAFFLTYHNSHLKVDFAIGDDHNFPDIKRDIDLNDKKLKDIAVVQAFLTKRAVGISDISSIPYYKESFRRKNKSNILLSTYAFPIIIEGKVEGIISFYGHKVGFFSSSLIFRWQQLLSEICENIGIIRLRRRSQLAIHQYEERLRLQIHELEENKKVMQNQAKKLREARAVAENVNRAQAEFIANMSHELRTPLNAILGFSEAMTTETFGPLPQQYREYVSYVYSSGQYLLSLINDILDLSSLEGGHTRLKDAEIVLDPLLKNVLSIAQHYPGGESRRITCQIKPQNLTIRLDERSLQQILLNILSNAIKFTEDDGKIDIDIRLTAQKEIQFTIKDNGIGIPPDKIKNLFQPFGQVENVMTRKHKGTGLGLVLVKRLTELQDGTVELKSKPGIGTKMILTFPADRVINDSKDKKRK